MDHIEVSVRINEYLCFLTVIDCGCRMVHQIRVVGVWLGVLRNNFWNGGVLARSERVGYNSINSALFIVRQGLCRVVIQRGGLGLVKVKVLDRVKNGF